MAYLFDSHYGKCSLADNETGIIIHWKTGDFNGTRKICTEGIILPDHKPAQFFTKKIGEMMNCILTEYPELI